MNVYASPSNNFKNRRYKVKIPDRYYIDPVAFYMDNLLESKTLRNLRKNKKIVDIGIKLKSGKVVPAGAKKNMACILLAKLSNYFIKK